jgi:hypothetical protein
MVKSSTGQGNQSNEFQTDQRSILLQSVIREGIRQAKQSSNQAHWSFLIAIIMSTASAVIGLGGAGLLLAGMASEGSVTTAIGLASGVCSYQLSKEAADRQKQANERLDQMLRELQEDDD